LLIEISVPGGKPADKFAPDLLRIFVGDLAGTSGKMTAAALFQHQRADSDR
jgi:hypothetical protein